MLKDDMVRYQRYIYSLAKMIYLFSCVELAPSGATLELIF